MKPLKTQIYFYVTLICTLILTGLFNQRAYAQAEITLTYFNQIPILENGRIKPLNSFARTHLKRLSGQEKWHGMDASTWLAETLFNPANAAEFQVFLIKDQALKKHLKLDKDQEYFNVSELRQSLNATQEEVIKLLESQSDSLTQEQQLLITVHENAATYNELLRSFSALLPLDIQLPEDIKKQHPFNQDNEITDHNFQTLLPFEQDVLRQVKETINQKGQDPEHYTDAEKTRALMSLQMQQVREGGINNNDFAAIPARMADHTIDWISPWQIFNEGKGSPQTAEFLNLWHEAAIAYRNNDQSTWTNNTQALLNKSLSVNDQKIKQTRLKLEILYNTLKPYHIAMSLYSIAILLLIISTIRASMPLHAATLTISLIAASTHLFGIISRIYILQRPPVGTLYESVLFVSLVCAAIAIIALIKTKKPIIPLVAQIASLALLSLAPIMLQSADSLELLVAVLNTNFWLATHVLCITIGYGVCIIAACLSHAYLILRLQKAKQKISQQGQEWAETLFKAIHKTTLVALFFTGVGTVLGGIWADQSWGRFWGWDPKENGALLIVLWIIWIQHGRLSGHLRPLSFAAFSAALNIVVALSWFGVNLLGVGLHSYGFTSGLASGLAIFCATETVLIIALFYSARITNTRNINEGQS